ncbi:tyrosine-type recombinase/integrase [Paucibacter sp. B2R-40]|uniref:tyrosine-type recombinase/integrase n=1 Tax=Paucibacter sp. B2R-40 TaxID=2893554 RepID=UPI0021E3F5BB|nr:tyrosine-type recombinase/integrase [Paucibacter sp. B2R-40]MCV2353566.1 tyrosine-type recombinase/integrase [Paucibacter sp. B2R-40]
MSISASLPCRLKTSLFGSGERAAFLVDSDGLPEPYSTLYVTMKLRNAGHSVSTQIAELNAINVLFAHAAEAGIELVPRFKAGDYLDRVECEALRRSSQRNYGPSAKHQAVVIALGNGKRGYIPAVPPVAPSTQYKRLSYFARFLKWLGEELAGDSGDGRAPVINAMVENIQALRPAQIDSKTDIESNTFSREDDALLCGLLAEGSLTNPFTPMVQVRNLLAIDLLRLLGKRRGEILNIRLSDINLSKRQIDIVRRADNVHDPRVNQPLVKTRSHTLPIGPSLVSLINQYLPLRRSVAGASKHPYLLVTHKSGPTQGQPMTIEALKEVFRTIKRAEPRLSHLHPHLLRHFNGDATARAQQGDQATPGNSERDRRQRNFLAGRAPESTMDSHYTARETERHANKTSLRTQEELTKAIKSAHISSEEPDSL